MLARLLTLLGRVPALKKGLWKRWYQYLARRYRDADWTFMNYGFAPSPGAKRRPLEPADEADRSWSQLYEHVAGAIDLTGKEVLEVGSGRGGGASFIKRYLGPSAVVGVDLSANAVALSTARHRIDGLMFQTGDAERLPFDAGRFDVVVNVESSHCYASMSRFIAEATRVLRPGGTLLHADFRTRDAVEGWRRDLQSSGLSLMGQTDITANVVAALDEDNERRLGLMRRVLSPFLMPLFRRFAGVPGSVIYEEFRRGETVYLSFVLEKPRAGK